MRLVTKCGANYDDGATIDDDNRSEAHDNNKASPDHQTTEPTGSECKHRDHRLY